MPKIIEIIILLFLKDECQMSPRSKKKSDKGVTFSLINAIKSEKTESPFVNTGFR